MGGKRAARSGKQNNVSGFTKLLHQAVQSCCHNVISKIRWNAGQLPDQNDVESGVSRRSMLREICHSTLLGSDSQCFCDAEQAGVGITNDQQPTAQTKVMTQKESLQRFG